MTVNELKEYIYDKDKIYKILDSVGCHHIIFHNNNNKAYYTCANPDGDNTSAITVRMNHGLSVRDYTREKEFPEASDIFTLVSYCLKLKKQKNDFYHTIKYIHELFGLNFSIKDKPNKQDKLKDEKQDPLYWFKKVRKKRAICIANDIEVKEIENTEEYAPYPHISFVREGIMPWTWKKFGLGYSYQRKRTVIPLRYWLTGELIGYNMRTSVEHADLLGIKKYWITPNYPKSIILFGLYENMEAIQKAKYVVVYEAEKSVLKRDSLGDSTGVAVQGHSLSLEQIKILIGLNVEIIIAFDNDIDRDYLRYCCSKFYLIRRVSYIYDTHGLLGEKDAPVDCGDRIFQQLLSERVKYDAAEHAAYLKSVKVEKE